MYVQKQAVNKNGFTATDGTIYPTRQEQIEANRVNHFLQEQQNMLENFHISERVHLRHLKGAAQAGEVTLTKDGVFETSPCEDHNIGHKVPFHPNTRPSCPSSTVGRRQKQKKETKVLLYTNIYTWVHI